MKTVARWRRSLASRLTERPGYTLPGSWTALIFACLSFTPSLLPRPALFQGVVTGVTSAIGYGLGVLGAWVWREFADRRQRPPAEGSWRRFLVVAAVALLGSLVLGVWWQRGAAGLVSLPPQNPGAALLVLPVAALFFVGLVGLGRVLGTGYRRLATWLAGHMGERAARVLGLILAAQLGALLLTGVLGRAVINAADSAYSLRDTTTSAGVTQPVTPDRSGGPGSLVPWDTLGMQGRTFVARGPNAEAISAASGAEAKNPVRAYAGLDSAEDAEERAALAVRDLTRANGFQRANLLVVTTTGSGWIEPSSASAFEYLTGGDSAIVSMQYSFLPSVMSFLVDQERAREAGRALFDAVYEKWSSLPSDQRPRLYVFGESLGSFGGEAAFSGEFDMANRVSGALFTGPPSFNPLYRSFVDRRDPGSREIEPVYRGGRTVRITTAPGNPIEPAGQPWSRSRVLYLQHASDPITWWNPDLILSRPDWLTEERGSDVLDSTRWVPFVTFWQLTADMPLGMSPGPGHGHNFSGEHVDAWAAILQTANWTPEKAARLKELVRSRIDQPYAASPETAGS